MLEHNFRRLPVVKENKIIGIITQTDVARGLYDFIHSHKDYFGKPKPKVADEASYCTKKTHNLIVCEKSKPQEKVEVKKEEKQPRKKP